MDDGSKEPPRANVGSGTFLQPTWLQRGIRIYNESHKILLDCCVSFLLFNWCFFRSLLNTKKS